MGVKGNFWPAQKLSILACALQLACSMLTAANILVFNVSFPRCRFFLNWCIHGGCNLKSFVQCPSVDESVRSVWCCICSVSPSCHLVSRPPPPAGRNLHISPVSPAPDFPNSIFTFVTLCKWYSARQYLAALSILPISSKLAFPYYFCQVDGAGYFHLHHKMKEQQRRGTRDGEWGGVWERFSFQFLWKFTCILGEGLRVGWFRGSQMIEKEGN